MSQPILTNLFSVLEMVKEAVRSMDLLATFSPLEMSILQILETKKFISI